MMRTASSAASSFFLFFGRPTGHLGVTGDLGMGFSFHSLGIVSSTEFTFTTKLSIVLCIVAQLLLTLLHKFEIIIVTKRRYP